MEFTAAQKRAAFYQAAEYIKKNPEMYDFGRIWVGGVGCPACMWGHVGRILGFHHKRYTVSDVPQALGFKHGDLTKNFSDEVRAKNGRYISYTSAADAPIILRAFADKHWPEPQQSTITHEPCGKSFNELMATLQSATA